MQRAREGVCGNEARGPSPDAPGEQGTPQAHQELLAPGSGTDAACLLPQGNRCPVGSRLLPGKGHVVVIRLDVPPVNGLIG